MNLFSKDRVLEKRGVNDRPEDRSRGFKQKKSSDYLLHFVRIKVRTWLLIVGFSCGFDPMSTSWSIGSTSKVAHSAMTRSQGARLVGTSPHTPNGYKVAGLMPS